MPLWHLRATLPHPTVLAMPRPQQDEWGVSEVAKTLDISESRVRQLDDILQPIRDRNGHRVYKREAIEIFLKFRHLYKRLGEAQEIK